jgi:hypothetical protein
VSMQDYICMNLVLESSIQNREMYVDCSLPRPEE